MIEEMNEKIARHDYWTEEYNDYLAKVNALIG